MNKEEKFNKVISEFLNFRKFSLDYSDSEVSEKQAEVFLLKEEDLIEIIRDYLIQNCLDIQYQAIMMHPLISEMSEEDQYYFSYYIAKSLSLYKNKEGKYKLVKFIPISYWNDDDKQYPLLVNLAKNNDNKVIQEIFDKMLKFIEDKTEENVDVKVFQPVMLENLTQYLFYKDVGSIVNFIEKLDVNTNRDKESINWYQNIVVPVIIESDSYKSIYIVNNHLNVQNINNEYPLDERKMYAEISFFNDVLERNESLKFYFWLSTVLNAPIIPEGNSNDIVSRDGFIHCVVSEDGLLNEFEVTIDLILGNGDVKVLKANKKVFRDGEIPEISSFWASRSSQYDSFTFTFGVKEEKEDHSEQYNSIFLMPKEVIRH